MTGHRHGPGRRPGPRERHGLHGRMPQGQRRATLVLFGLLWVSGCVWLILDRYLATRTEFGATPHPWAAPTLTLHGILAVVSMYLLGWISARHVTHWWPRRRRRLSGGVLAGFMGLLAVSGFALFFLSDDRPLHAAAIAHDVLGVAVIATAIQHWLSARSINRRAPSA